MNKKQLRYSFNCVINAAENLKCENLYHKKGKQHEHDEVCMVEYELNKHIHNVREYMKKQGI